MTTATNDTGAGSSIQIRLHTHKLSQTLLIFQLPPEVPAPSAERRTECPQPLGRGPRRFSRGRSTKRLLRRVRVAGGPGRRDTKVQPPGKRPEEGARDHVSQILPLNSLLTNKKPAKVVFYQYAVFLFLLFACVCVSVVCILVCVCV